MNFFKIEQYPNHTQNSMSISELINKWDNEDLKKPDYQREPVWNNVAKQSYLETLSKKGPVFGFVLKLDNDNIYWIIDGQNRAKTIYDFVKDKFKFTNEENDNLLFSELTMSEQRKFLNMRIYYTEAIDWDDDMCQEYFRIIQGGVNLTNGEKIHSAMNNIFNQKIRHLNDKYHDFIISKKKDGGLQYNTKRFVHYEIIGNLLRIFMYETYYDRSGKSALLELQKWDKWSEENNHPPINTLTNACDVFIQCMDYYYQFVQNSTRLNKGDYARDSTLIRNIYFIYINQLHLSDLTDEIIYKFDYMLHKVLDKNSRIHDEITIWGTSGRMNLIMDKYKEIFNAVDY